MEKLNRQDNLLSSKMNAPMSTTAATTFYKEEDDERPGAAKNTFPLTLLTTKDMDIKSPTGLLLRDSTMDDDNLIESQLLDDMGEGDDRHLLDNLISEENGGASLYRTERIDSVKILSEKEKPTTMVVEREGGAPEQDALILEEEVGEVIQVGITPKPIAI